MDRESIAFRWACEYGSLEVVKFLLQETQENDLFSVSSYNHYALRYACRNSHEKVVLLILEEKNTFPKEGQTEEMVVVEVISI